MLDQNAAKLSDDQPSNTGKTSCQYDGIIEDKVIKTDKLGRPVTDRQLAALNRFQPGQSGNPSGRPKKAEAVREAALDGSVKAMNALIKALDVEMEKETPNPATLVMIAKEMLDRGLGKPNQSVDLNQTHSFSEDFEAFIRRLNDKSDTAAKQLQDDAAAQVITVDFDELERGS